MVWTGQWHVIGCLRVEQDDGRLGGVKRIGILGACGAAMCLGDVRAAEAEWDQAKAKKMVANVLEVEKAKTRPWNRIPWRAVPADAVAEAKKEGKPLLVFFYVEQMGPPLERCCPEGRLLRTHALSDSTVLSIVKSRGSEAVRLTSRSMPTTTFEV